MSSETSLKVTDIVFVGAPASVAIFQGNRACWKCKKETPVVCWLRVTVGEYIHELTIAQIGDYPGLFEDMLQRIPQGVNLSAIKPRYSKMQNRKYLSNGCIHCDALLGEFFEHEAWHGASEICSFDIIIDERWRKAIIGDNPHE